MKKSFNIEYKDIISAENLLLAWQEFLNGKKNKASVRDRLLHHAIYRKLYSFFDRVFIDLNLLISQLYIVQIKVPC